MHLRIQYRTFQSGTLAHFCGSKMTDDNIKSCFGWSSTVAPLQHRVVFLLPCVQKVIICIVNIVFLLLFPVALVACTQQNSSQRNRTPQISLHRQPRLYLFVAVLCTCFSLGNTGVGVWLLGSSIVNRDPIPLQDWIFNIIQGLAWIVIALTLKLNLGRAANGVAKVWWVLTFLLGTFIAAASAVDISEGKSVSLYRGMALASWPLCCCLLFCSLRKTGQTGSTLNNIIEPLLKNSTTNKENGNITLESTAGLFSRATFSWLASLLRLGYSRPLELEDVPCIAPEDQSDTNYRAFEKAWAAQFEEKNKSSGKQPTIYALAKCYWKEIFKIGIFAFFRSTSVTAGPLILRFFVDFASGKMSFKYEGYVLVAVLFLAKIIESISQRHWYFGARRLGMKMKTSLIAAIYQKELSLSSIGKRKHATGEIVNYIAVDAYRVGEFPWWLHWVWIVPFQLSIAVAIFFFTVGLATLPGLILILLLILLSSPLGTSLQKCQSQFMVAQDERLRKTTEILNGMKVIKLQAWEDMFAGLIAHLREREFQWLTASQKTRSLGAIVYWISPIVVGSIIFFTCIFLNIPLNPTTIFTVLGTFRIVQEPVRIVPDLLAAIVQVRVSLQRIDDFLQDDELPEGVVKRNYCEETEYAIKIDDGVLSWNPEEGKPTLKGINLAVRSGEKVAVCGAIGSGKSTLLHSILGEVPKISGTVKLSGTVAYVAQTAWIQTGTIKDNILFGMPMDEERYKKVLKACALEQDIESFSHGDLTEIGERGVNMSGGQKQRIQLARAVYNDADVYLLDDPFSAVDAHTAATLFNDCVLGALRNKTVVLVTHQVEFLPAVEFILVMQEGEIKQAGTYEQLLKAGETFEELITAHQEALVTLSHEDSKMEDSELQVSRVQRKLSGMEICENHSRVESLTNVSQLIQVEERETGDTGMKPYYDYITISRGTMILMAMGIAQGAFVMSNVYSNLWLAQQVSNPRIPGSLLIGVYAVLSVISGICVFIRSRLTVILGLKASKAFFNGLMSSVTKAPMAFFDATPTGRILNRASADMSVLDIDIPFCFGFIIAAGFDLTGILVVIALVTWQILIVAIPMIFIVQKLQKFYLASSRELMRMNAITKAPIVNSSSETISGAVTIRAFQMVEQFKKKNMQLVDRDASLFFHTQAAAEWLTMRLEAIGNIVLCVAAFLLVLLPANQISPGFAGLAISYALALNSCQVFLVWWQCCFSNYIISVERIKQYMQLPKEAPEIIESNRPPLQWPNKGKVTLENLQIRYRTNSPLVLRGITCTFQGGQKVGVVGRTGSGKTTLISALFRLVEPAGGKIYIDNLDICSIGLHDLRLRLGVIPQEPILFRGTIRSNLDPLSQYADSVIWETLDKCLLGELIRKIPNQLDSHVSDEGENWSCGQRQLFCLGRVLLKRSKILVLDEATASIDSATDALLQRVIRKEFSDCTVIIVAHRIPSVISTDMVLALRDGTLAEFDTPKRLMENKASLFAKLVAEYWAQSSHASRQKLPVCI